MTDFADGMDIESLTAHLTILGWRPARIKGIGFPCPLLGVASARQFAYIVRGYAQIRMIGGLVTDAEWWEIPDTSIRLLAKTLDSNLIGWGE